MLRSVPAVIERAKKRRAGEEETPAATKMTSKQVTALHHVPLLFLMSSCSSVDQSQACSSVAVSCRVTSCLSLSLSLQRRAAERASKQKKVGARYYETHNVKNKNRDKKTPALEGKKSKRAKR